MSGAALLALSALFAASPAAPGEPPPGFPAGSLRLVDRVRCGDPSDPHPFEASGGAGVETILGRRCRITGRLKYSWMRWSGLRIAEKGRLHVIAVSYPEDAKRAALICWPPGTGKSHLNTIYTRHSMAWRTLTVPLFTGGGFPRDAFWIGFLNVGRGDYTGRGLPDPDVVEMCQARCLWCLSGVTGNTLRDVEPPAIGEISVWEVLDTRAAFPPLEIAIPPDRGRERGIGTSRQLSKGSIPFGRQGPQMRAREKEWFIIDHLGLNLIDVGDPQRWRMSEELYEACDRRGIKVVMRAPGGLGLDAYFEKTRKKRVLPPSPVRELFETDPSLWDRTEPLMYDVPRILGYNPWDWLNPEMEALFVELIERDLVPAMAAHPCVYAVRFTAAKVGVSLQGVELFEKEVLGRPLPGTTYREKQEAIDRSGLRGRWDPWLERKRYDVFRRFAARLRRIRPQLVIYAPFRYYPRTLEHLGATTPYPFEPRGPIPFASWAKGTEGVLAGIEQAFYTRYSHEPPAGHPVFACREILAEVEGLGEGWASAVRVYESEVEGRSHFGWVLDNINMTGPEWKASPLQAMAHNPRYLFLNTREVSDKLADLRHLASIWRAFPWGRARDLSPWGKLEPPSPPGRPSTGPASLLECRGRLLLLNHGPLPVRMRVALRVQGIPAGESPLVRDAVTGENVAASLDEGTLRFQVVLEPYSGATAVLADGLRIEEEPARRREGERPPRPRRASLPSRERTISYLLSLQNEDGGFAFRKGMASHVANTRAAVSALRLLGSRPARPEACARFLEACRSDGGEAEKGPARSWRWRRAPRPREVVGPPRASFLRKPRDFVRGYAYAPGAKDEIWYTCCAVLALRDLGMSPRDPASLSRYIASHASGVAGRYFGLKALVALGWKVPDPERWIAEIRAGQRLPPKGDGSFGTTGSGPSVRLTAMAVSSLALLGARPIDRDRALGFLAAAQRPDGGFGYPGWRSEVWNTALAVEALRAARMKLRAPERAVEFLKQCAGADGGFGPWPGEPSTPLTTLWALQALRTLGALPAM